MSTLLLIDGNALAHRAYHALPPFKTKKGIPTNAVYGFLSMVQKAIADFHPTHIIVCFDTPTPTFRKKIFKEYQIHRPKLEDNLKTQLPMIQEALEKGGIVTLEKPGFEADDLIGTITYKLASTDAKVLVFTGDKDIFQLVSDKVFVIAPLIGLSNVKLYDSSEVKKRLSILPRQIIDYKALMGDPSDNYPGARGIGPKTATQLIKDYQTVENIYRHLDQLKSKTKKILEDHKDDVLLSKKLATILTDVKIDFDFDRSRFDSFDPHLKKYLEQLEIHSLANRLFQKTVAASPPKKIEKNKDQMGLF